MGAAVLYNYLGEYSLFASEASWINSSTIEERRRKRRKKKREEGEDALTFILQLLAVRLSQYKNKLCAESPRGSAGVPSAPHWRGAERLQGLHTISMAAIAARP